MSLRLYPAGATMANTQRAHPDGLLKTENDSNGAFVRGSSLWRQIKSAAARKPSGSRLKSN
jgi:hypothetical protein